MNLMNCGIKMTIETDKPSDMNFIRKHILVQAKELNASLRVTTTRGFSNSAGAYSANVGLIIENGGQEDEVQLLEQFLTRFFLRLMQINLV